MTTFADTILESLRADLPGDVKVYDAIVSGVPPARYVVCYIPAGLRQMSNIRADSDAVSVEFQTTTVTSDTNPATAAVYCRWLATAVRDALTDLVVTADGHTAGRIWHEGSQSPRPDEETPDKKVYATDQFSLLSVRTS